MFRKRSPPLPSQKIIQLFKDMLDGISKIAKFYTANLQVLRIMRKAILDMFFVIF